MNKGHLNVGLVALLALSVMPAGNAGEDEAVVKMPLVTYKALLMEHLEREKEKTAGPKEEKNEWSLDESHFKVLPGRKQVSAECRIEGRMLKGKPGEKIKLFNETLLLTGPIKATGCNLVSQDGALYVVPSVAGAGKFSAEFSFAFMTEEGLDSLSCRIPVPNCLKNIIDIEAVKGIKLISSDGANVGPASYAAASGISCNLRLKAESENAEIVRAPDIDVFCDVTPEKKCSLVTAYFVSRQDSVREFSVKLPANSRVTFLSLPGSAVERTSGDVLKITLPEKEKGIFQIKFMIENSGSGGLTRFRLPIIEGNAGREGLFIIREPENANIVFTAKGDVEDSAMPQSFPELNIPKDLSVREALKGELAFTMKYLERVKMPEFVADAIYFMTNFSENGNILTSMYLSLPVGFPDSKLLIKKVKGSEIWGLKINGIDLSMLEFDKDTWAIPVNRSEKSDIELSLLSKGEKTGLHGRLEAVLPDTGLSAEKLFFTALLPAHLEVISADSPLAPYNGDPLPPPKGFKGRSYSFSGSFCKGSVITTALEYNEIREDPK